MLDKINAFAVAVYFSIAGFVDNAKAKTKELLNDERGLSGVVVAILLILVAVLAVVLIWQFLGDYIEDMWDTITNADDDIKAR